ncbi:MAG: cytidyltransferase, partial [Lachnospiraceae bacterium]|nr:cytidyltransferase [Lachnospiraceae bacterium]
VRQAFYGELADRIDDFDVIFLCDFGHGLIDEKVRDILQKKARYLVLNCQTNSANYGMNIITKYNRADAFTLDQRELKLAFPMYMSDEHTALEKLSAYLGCDGWLTRGAEGAYGIKGQKIHECPAFTLTVKDTVGAGDAFYAIAGLYMAAGAPAELGTFMGNIAGALGANIVGNKESVEKVNVLKYAGTLMNV